MKRSPSTPQLQPSQNLILSQDQLLMLREDAQALLYHKLNAIIQLQQVEQLQQQNHHELTTLNHSIKQPTNTQTTLSSTSHPPPQSPPLTLAHFLSTYHCHIQQQLTLTRTKGDLDVQLQQLSLQQNTITQQLKILSEEINQFKKSQMEAQGYQNRQQLLALGKKYNLVKVLITFMNELKESMVRQLLQEELRTLIEGIDQKSGRVRSSKEVLKDFTIYLQEYYSQTVSREVIKSINQLVSSYNSAKNCEFSDRIALQIQKQGKELDKVRQLILDKHTQSMDLKIDMQILGEQIKQQGGHLSHHQRTVQHFLQQEATIMEAVYQKQNFSIQKCHSFFYNQLHTRCQQLIKIHLTHSHSIGLAHRQIDNYNQFLQCCQKLLTGSHGTLHSVHNQKEEQSDQEDQTLKGHSQSIALKESTLNYQNSRRQITHRSPGVLKPKKPQQKFVVKKGLNIGSQSGRGGIGRGRSERWKTYEVRLTKKWLILQPLGGQTLSVSEKVQLSHIKGFECSGHKSCLQIDCGGCTLNLQFITLNFDLFCKKLSRLINKGKSAQNYDL